MEDGSRYVGPLSLRQAPKADVSFVFETSLLLPGSLK